MRNSIERDRYVQKRLQEEPFPIKTYFNEEDFNRDYREHIEKFEAEYKANGLTLSHSSSIQDSFK